MKQCLWWNSWLVGSRIVLHSGHSVVDQSREPTYLVLLWYSYFEELNFPTITPLDSVEGADLVKIYKGEYELAVGCNQLIHSSQ
ncbi:hypothetical protein DEU56DRAFT_797813 [Suillus clintonianus]|uniref:uncharacterized protein n=1 Tax=Suillus clintonianus TaxID=1904413 RepID=UPI001B85C3A9|nr:uncharacterized protein DEU56DRAFT_797813 [Suillus clintonianus]KAG2140629.1 hypothetical protein DEU56DRAFT_797813 [Suillus clintonianus]